MGFLTGGVTALRFKVQGTRPYLFNDEHIERLAERAIGKQAVAGGDGVQAGWTAGGSILDTTFSLEKNRVNDALCFDLRIDTNVPPADLLKAYIQLETEALARDNPSGFASARQKREAKQIARDRIEQEAKDGRFLKRKCVPVLWDRLSNEVLFGATSYAQADRFARLFEQTFSANLERPDSTTGKLWCVTADPRAALVMGQAGQLSWINRTIEPAKFVPDAKDGIAWIAGDNNRDFLGNEFALWLWYYTDAISDTVALGDGSEVTFMISRSLVMECPRGDGADGFKSLGPSRVPEARRAAQAGKLPRKVGLTMVRHGEQYELTLHAETLAFSGAKLPAADGNLDARGRLDERIGSVRALLETLDLLYEHFVHLRLSPLWELELMDMQRWLANGARFEGVRRGDSEDVLRLTGQAVAEALKDLGAVSVEVKPGAAA